MNIQGLKPCPFCGGNAIEVSPYDQKPLGSRWIIKCVDCGASIQGSHRAMNKAAWNQRAHEPRTGHWSCDENAIYHCSECGCETTWDYNFCPDCGAMMNGDEEE